MADKNNKRGVNGQGKAASPATGPPGAHGIKFSADLRGLHDQFQELLKSTGGVQEYGALLGEKESLQKKLQGMQLEVSRLTRDMEDSKKSHAAQTSEMQRRIEQLETHTSWLQNDYGKKYTEWSKSGESHEVTSKELAEVRVELRESQMAAAAARSETKGLRKDCDKQAKDLGDALRHCKFYDKKLKIWDLEVEELKQRVGEATVERQDAVEQLGLLPLDTESVSESFGPLADRIQKLAEVVASKLPNPGVAIGLPENFPIRVPGSNSRAARSMRRAVAETIVAEELRRSVFLDFHSEHLNLDGLRGTLKWLEEKDCQGESDVIRCQLARALARRAPDSSIWAKHIASGIQHTLAPWIPDESTRNQFEDGLAAVFKGAIELWQPIQQAEKRVEAIFDLGLQYWDDRVDRREDFDGIAPGGQAHRPSPGVPTNLGAPIAVLFPHIDTADGEIFSGSALFQNQLMVAEAYRELQTQQASSGGGGLPRRRLSMRDPPASRNRRVSSSSVDEARLRLGSVGVAGDASTSQRRSPVGPDTTASVSSTRSQRPGATTNGR